MSVPKFFEFFRAFLIALNDGQPHAAKEIRNLVAKEMALTEQELSEMIPSGRQTTFANRIAWAKTYLNKAGLVSTPKRGFYQITDEGRKALASGQSIDLAYLEQFEQFRSFHETKGTSHNPQKASSYSDNDFIATDSDESPIEVLDAAFQQVNNSLASELMDEVMQLSPSEFEALVV